MSGVNAPSGNPIVYATVENMRRHAGQKGIVMFSPYTGEQYSANPGDYFWAKPGQRFKDSTGRVMRLQGPLPSRLQR